MSARTPRVWLWGALFLVGLLGIFVPGGLAQDERGIAYSIELQASVNPATEQWLGSALDDAAEEEAEIAIVRLDTPGGLDTSMREMIKDIIAAPIPVVVYVSPDGGRAASAGLFVTQAGDVAAMAPETNIGSATPISIGGGDIDKVLGRKIRNDAAAYVRALADGHGRNPNLAERMVRKAVNVTAREALEAGLIDVVAGSEEELLRKLDGFRVRGPKRGVLDTEGLRIERHDRPFQFELLEIIVNPTVSYLLLLAGIAGIAFELFNPGLIAPGSLGVVSLLLGLYGTSQLPVTAAGILLLLLGLGLILSETQLPTHGILGGSGVLALIFGGLLLYDTDNDAFEISAPAVIITGLVIGGFLAFAIQRAFAARHEPVHTGWEEMIGAVGEVRVPPEPTGQVFVEGALWRAKLAEGAGNGLGFGARVRVESVEGLTLYVRPLAEAETAAAGPGTGSSSAEEGAS